MRYARTNSCWQGYVGSRRREDEGRRSRPITKSSMPAARNSSKICNRVQKGEHLHRSCKPRPKNAPTSNPSPLALGRHSLYVAGQQFRWMRRAYAPRQVARPHGQRSGRASEVRAPRHRRGLRANAGRCGLPILLLARVVFAGCEHTPTSYFTCSRPRSDTDRARGHAHAGPSFRQAARHASQGSVADAPSLRRRLPPCRHPVWPVCACARELRGERTTKCSSSGPVVVRQPSSAAVTAAWGLLVEEGVDEAEER